MNLLRNFPNTVVFGSNFPFWVHKFLYRIIKPNDSSQNSPQLRIITLTTIKAEITITITITVTMAIAIITTCYWMKDSLRGDKSSTYLFVYWMWFLVKGMLEVVVVS